MSNLTEKELIFKHNPVKITFKTLKTERVFHKADNICPVEMYEKELDIRRDTLRYPTKHSLSKYESIRKYAEYLQPALDQVYGFDVYYLVPAYDITGDGIVVFDSGEMLVSQAEFEEDFPGFFEECGYELRLIDTYVGCKIAYLDTNYKSILDELVIIAYDGNCGKSILDEMNSWGNKTSINKSMDQVRSDMKAEART